MDIRNTFTVGDTHGSYKGLMQALGKAGFDPAQDLLICLGDTQDGWSEAPAIIDYYRELSDSLIYILGNHDICFIEWVDWGMGMHSMVGHGGDITAEVYRGLGVGVATIHSEWLKRQRYIYRDDQERVFVHAGWNPALPYDDRGQMMDDVNEYIWNRSFWSGMFAGRAFAKEHREVFIGHTPTLSYAPYLALPMNRKNVWNLDTGSAFKGVVTVMDVNTKEYWQSEPCAELYPSERGRNKLSFTPN